MPVVGPKLYRERDGSVRVEHDRHLDGPFSRMERLRWLAEAGFRATVIPVVLTDLEPGAYEVFVAKRPV